MTSTELPQTLTGERADLLATLAQHRFFLRNTTRDLTDEQAGRRTTRSELCLGGLIKHVAHGERQWVSFILEGPSAMSKNGKEWADWTEEDYADYHNDFRMQPGETLAGVLADYERAAERTNQVLAALPSLDDDHPLPSAPWFEPGARWSARRALLHIIAETAQHSGHADIIRESLDGAKSMG
ncbi:DinB family protein [Pseudonocardia eucalypti]|uniref:DinB family protein n=1 Tax=Pseudonocardia eucalypti TaxID=648755 RepID=A0ABP9PD05_9PSEU|nr:putative damage-inducible protein DinB [Pseudonocardia eucalypti]